MITNHDGCELVGLSEAAQRLHLNVGTLRKYRTRGILPQPAGTVSGHPLFCLEEIEAWVETRPKLGKNVNGDARVLWPKRLAPFMDTPGVWQRWPHPVASPTAYHLNAGRYHHPPGRWQFKLMSEQGKYFLWAVYLGPDKEST